MINLEKYFEYIKKGEIIMRNIFITTKKGEILEYVVINQHMYITTVVVKVKTYVIASTSQIRRTMILVIMYTESFKNGVILFLTVTSYSV